MLRRGFKKFDLDYLNVPEQLKKRGVDDPDMVNYYAIFENGISVIVFNWFQWYALRFKLISKMVCLIFG